jgi:subtilisin family serine protease
MSFSGIDLPNILNPFREATFNAYAAGKVLIVSSGNNDSNEIVYPANYPWTIAVGATNESGQRVSKNLGYSWGSNYGDHISIVAPGVNCPTNAHSQSTPKIFNGTSCSTPHVSGAAGLILSKSKDLGLNITNDEIRHLMENSARRYDAIRRDKYLGYGILNAGGALKILQ